MTSAAAAIRLRVSPGHPIADTAPGGDLEQFYRSGPNFTEVGYGRFLLTGWSDWVPLTLKMTSAAAAIRLRVSPGHPIADTAPGGRLGNILPNWAKFYRSGLRPVYPHWVVGLGAADPQNDQRRRGHPPKSVPWPSVCRHSPRG
jgi:hypothetical protein